MFFLPLTAVVPADARTAVVARPFSTHQFLAPTLGGHHVHFCVVSLAELVAVPPRPGGARRAPAAGGMRLTEPAVSFL